MYRPPRYVLNEGYDLSAVGPPAEFSFSLSETASEKNGSPMIGVVTRAGAVARSPIMNTPAAVSTRQGGQSGAIPQTREGDAWSRRSLFDATVNVPPQAEHDLSRAEQQWTVAAFSRWIGTGRDGRRARDVAGWSRGPEYTARQSNCAAIRTRGMRPLPLAESITFSGDPVEDPKLFINELVRYFEQNHVTYDPDKVELASSRLRGRARDWYRPVRGYRLSFNEFSHRLLSCFDSRKVLMTVRAELYGSEQALSENSESFIHKKRALYFRINSIGTEQELLDIILPLLRPSLRSRLRNVLIRTIKELITMVVELEEDLASEAAEMRYRRNQGPGGQNPDRETDRERSRPLNDFPRPQTGYTRGNNPQTRNDRQANRVGPGQVRTRDGDRYQYRRPNENQYRDRPRQENRYRHHPAEDTGHLRGPEVSTVPQANVVLGEQTPIPNDHTLDAIEPPRASTSKNE
ncbi:hypothetical protein ABEB36_015226 [Hypothenemus hampei]|uniref:Retrotransposon gag domain-containing protein n=1 Tax=Hypothenemus hampei TaxID=57062 RepID=A0ABD1E0U1_HYPHA